MAINVTSRSLDLYTRRGNTRWLWRSTQHSAIDVANVSWASSGVVDLTPRLISVVGTEAQETYRQIPSFGGKFKNEIIEERVENDFQMRFYSSTDLTDEIELLFADDQTVKQGWLYVLQDVPYATATDSEGSRCDYVPVYTLGASKDLTSSNTAASYTVNMLPKSSWSHNEIVAP